VLLRMMGNSEGRRKRRLSKKLKTEAPVKGKKADRARAISVSREGNKGLGSSWADARKH